MNFVQFLNFKSFDENTLGYNLSLNISLNILKPWINFIVKKFELLKKMLFLYNDL